MLIDTRRNSSDNTIQIFWAVEALREPIIDTIRHYLFGNAYFTPVHHIARPINADLLSTSIDSDELKEILC